MMYAILFLFSQLFAEAHIDILKGNEIASKASPIIEYINEIYQNPPYLYAGDDEKYREYLLEYMNDPEAVAQIVTDKDKIVGIALGIPLDRSRNLYKQPFQITKNLYYIGEFGLDAAYRGKGLEDKLLKNIEAVAKEKGYNTLAIWELSPSSPSEKSPLLPLSFWEKSGFKEHPELRFLIYWTHIDEEKETEHKAVYWLKSI